MNKPYFILFFLLSLFTLDNYGQDNIDALMKQLNKQRDSKELLLKIANHYITVDKINDSIFAYGKLLEQVAHNENDSLTYAEAYGIYTKGHYLNADYDPTLENASKAIRLFEKFDQNEKAANIKITVGNAYQVLFRNKEALQYLNEAANWANPKDQIVLNIGLAAVHTQINDLEKAIHHYEEAYRQSNEIGDESYQYNIQNGLAVIYNKNGDKEKSITALQTALGIAQNQNNYLGELVCHHNIAYHYLGKKEYATAKINFEKAIGLFPKAEHKFMMGSTYQYYAETLLQLNDIREAERNLDKAEILFKEMNSGRMGSVLNIRANIRKAQSRYSESIALLNESLVITRERGLAGTTKNNYLDLAETYEESGNKEMALATYKTYERIKDSIAELNKTKEIEALKVKFDVTQYEQELRVKEQEVQLLDAQNKNSNYRNLLLGILTLGLLFFIYRQRKINQLNKQAIVTEKELSQIKETQIDHNKREITNYAIHITEHNKLLNTSLEQIKKLKRNVQSKEMKDGLVDLQIYLQDHLNINKEKVKLDAQVKESQEDFTFKLKTRYPNLSQKEVQVATYLVLNLSSKQVANQMGIREQSIYNYRLSLRKKLNLEKDINLSEFLQNL